jgi:N-acetylmuramoyl-L-alanine amidase
MIFLVKILLDAGHGGKDSGAVGNGLLEKDLNLDICKRIETGLKAYENCEVILTRSTDVFVSLEDRTKKANNNNADVLLSVHINSATKPTAKGFESYVYIGTNSPTVAYQNTMHNEIIKAIGKNVDDRGKRQKNLHMLRESKMKAILTENLFISNPADAALLAQDEFRQKLAQGHINGLERFLGLKKTSQPPPTEPTPPSEKKVWVVQVGAFDERKNADAMAADLRKAGYRPFVKYE